MTGSNRPLLQGDVTLFLRQDLREREQKKLRKKPRLSGAEMRDEDRHLWEALGGRGRGLGGRTGCAAVCLFHDATLAEMFEYRPTSEADLMSLNGVGRVKLERYGRAFLDVICAEF